MYSGVCGVCKSGNAEKEQQLPKYSVRTHFQVAAALCGSGTELDGSGSEKREGATGGSVAVARPRNNRPSVVAGKVCIG